MCDPVSLSVAAIGATVLSTGVSAYGAIQQGNYQAAVARNNQIIANRAADDAIDRGKEAERQQRMKTQQILGRQSAVMAANGLDISSGSPLDIVSDTARFGEFDALTIRSNAEREAYGYRVQGAQFGADASMARRAGYLNAAGSLLTGASTIAGGLYNMGAFSGGGAPTRGMYTGGPDLTYLGPSGIVGGGV